MPVTSVTNKIKVKETSVTSSKTTKTKTSKILTSEAGKHGVIYDTGTTASLTDYEDMKILLVVSGILAGLGFMYFYGH